MKKIIKLENKTAATEEEIAQELATELDVDIDDIEIEEETDHAVDFWRVDAGYGEFIVFSNYEDANWYTRNYVREQMEDEPEMFTSEWLENFIYVTDTDKRLIAQDMVDHYYDMDEEDVVRDANVEEEYEDAEEKGDTNEMERIVDQAREDLAEEESERIYKELDTDPIGYFVDEMGIYSREEILQQGFIHIDYEEASKDAVAVDGVAHFLAHYDGEENELSGDIVYYRTN